MLNLKNIFFAHPCWCPDGSFFLIVLVEKVDCFVVDDFVERCLLVAHVLHVEYIVMVESVVIVDIVIVMLIEHVVLNSVHKKVIKFVPFLEVIECRFWALFVFGMKVPEKKEFDVL